MFTVAVTLPPSLRERDCAGLHDTLVAARNAFEYYGEQGVTHKELELTLQGKANEGECGGQNV